MPKPVCTILLFFSLMVVISARAQSADALIRQGNRNYNKQEYDQSLSNYDKALKKSPGNPDAQFNQGDALYRKSDYEKAVASYDDVLQSKADDKTRQSAYYNKGVAEIRQKKLEESINSWKNALRLNPSDSDARENLVKALLEKEAGSATATTEQKRPEREKKG